MKSKRIATLALLGVLSVGGVKGYAQMMNNTIPKNTSVVAKNVLHVNNKESQMKQMAGDAFKKYFNDEVNSQNLQVREAKLKDQNAYLITNNDKTNYRLALINAADNKILHLQSSYGEPKSQEYKNYSLDEAKKLATDFVKNNNILGKDYTLSQEKGKEINADKTVTAYFLYFKYDQNKECLVTVNKELKKVDQFILLDECNGPRDEDKVVKNEGAANKDSKQVTESTKATIDENKIKEMASDGFKKYFNETVSAEDLEIEKGKLSGGQSSMVFYKNQTRNNMAVLDNNYKIMDIHSNTKLPSNNNYQNYTYDAAKTVVMDFLKQTNAIGKNYTLLKDQNDNQDQHNEMNAQKEAYKFFFHFKYDENKECVITVDKNSKKVDRIIFEYKIAK